MKKAKAFDCIRVKDEIQAKLSREWRGLTDEQIRRRIRRKLATSKSPVAKLWRALEARDKAAAKPPPSRSAHRTKRQSRRVGSPA